MALVVVTVLSTAVKMAMDARRRALGDPPKAVNVYVPLTGNNTVEGPITLIIGRSRQFGVNILVTVYYQERLGTGRGDIFERAIGIGQVINIQENGLIQVRVLHGVLNHPDLWQRIRDREMMVLSNVIIKPSIDFNAVGIEVRFNE